MTVFWWIILSVKFSKKTNWKRQKKKIEEVFDFNGKPRKHQRVWNKFAGNKSLHFRWQNTNYFRAEVTIHGTTETERFCCRRFFSIPTSKKFPVYLSKVTFEYKKCTVYSSCVCETKGYFKILPSNFCGTFTVIAIVSVTVSSSKEYLFFTESGLL